MKKLLILTQYYPPETGAPQNRLHELALRIKDAGIDVEVLTAMPNYPKMEIFDSYKGKRYLEEEIDGIRVYRSRIYVSKSRGMVARLLNYFSFVWTSFFTGMGKLDRYDYLMFESPPLFLGMSAYPLAKFKRAKLIMNVSDLWPESAEKLGLVTNRFFLRLATWLEEFLYRKSVLITGQTQGIVRDISSRFPDKKTYWLPNGVDLTYFKNDSVESSWRVDQGFAEGDFLLLYAGIVGHAQGLEILVNAADRLKDQAGIYILVLGDGPEKEKLLKMKADRKLDNLRFFDPVLKTEMPAIVKAIDVAVVPLKKLPLFEGAIPSKIFENLAMEKPILLGVKGEAKELFIDEGRAGLYFEPENDEELANQILALKDGQGTRVAELGKNGRAYVERKFDRNKIAEAFYNELRTLEE